MAAELEGVNQLQLFTEARSVDVLLVAADARESATIRRRLQRLLNTPYTVREAIVGSEVAVMVSEPPDVMLLCVESLDGSPVETLVQLRRLGVEVPIIVVHNTPANEDEFESVITEVQDVIGRSQATGRRLDTAIRAAIARKQAEISALNAALADPVTGLGSRASIMQRLDRALRHLSHAGDGWQVCVLFIDLDRFKQVNDRYGHAKGDELLRTVGERISGAVRAHDPIARFGGDEFVVLIEGHRVEGLAHRVGLRILNALERPFSLDGHLVKVRGSLGLAVASGAETSEHVLANADAALYEAKRLGRNRLVAYDDRLRKTFEEHRAISVRFAHALEHGDLELVRRRVVDLRSNLAIGEFVSAEWSDPITGRLAMDRVRQLAAGQGLGPRLGAWMVRRSFEDRIEGPFATDSLRMFLGLPSGLVEQSGFEVQVLTLCRTHEVDPAQVCLVLEEFDFDAQELIEPTLRHLIEHGTSVCVDGFGRGRSSLRLFCSDLVDHVRLAPELTHAIESDAQRGDYVRGLVQIADSVGQSLVATEIDTPATLAAVRELGCHAAELASTLELRSFDELPSAGRATSHERERMKFSV